MPDENDKPPREGQWIKVFYSDDFLQEAAKRGLPPEYLHGRLMDLAVEADKEGRQLFEDWESRTGEDRFRWCLDFARERARLEFPYLDEGEADEAADPA